MLIYLFDWLAQFEPAFRVFHYITLRAIMSTLTALVVSFLIGPKVIRWLTEKKIGQAIREDGPQSHFSKENTPTMGGVMILFAIFVAVLLWGDLSNPYLLIALATTLGFGLIGAYDDYRKVAYRDPNGLKARHKYLLQSILGLGAAWALYVVGPQPQMDHLLIPFMKDTWLYLGMGTVVLGYFVIVGTSNAVNLTDGLDGLAILPSSMVAGALGIFAYASGHSVFANYLHIPYIPGVGELSLFAGAIVGAGLGILWFNTHPARVFLGDTGSLALGAALGVLAIATRQELVLFIMGGVFVAEAVSVMLQVGSYKLRRKRIFLMAPLHHHFEMKGWPEQLITVRFWIITIILVLIGLASLKIR